MEDKKRKISVFYEEVIPSDKNAYSTMRFRIGEEYEIEVPADDRVAEMVMIGEFDKASKLVKQAVKYQIKRLQDPMMVKTDEMDAEVSWMKLNNATTKTASKSTGGEPGPNCNTNLTQSKTAGELMSPAVLQALEELNKGTTDGNAGK